MRTFIQGKSTEETSLDNIKAEISSKSYVRKNELVTLQKQKFETESKQCEKSAWKHRNKSTGKSYIRVIL